MKSKTLEEIENDNSLLKEKVTNHDTTGLAGMVLQYVSQKLNLGDEVHFEEVLDVFIDEWPEFISLIAEENHARGYKQGLEDQQAWELIHGS